MKIAEICSPELRPTQPDTDAHHSHILSQLEASVKHIERQSTGKPLTDPIVAELRQHLTQLTECSPFSNSLKLQIWKLSYRLWNACVDSSNAAAIRSSSTTSAAVIAEDHAKLRHLAADLLFLASDVIGVPSPAIKSASIYYKTGLIWHNLRKFDLASICFERATDLVSKVELRSISDAGEKKLLLDLNLARSRTAWDVSDKNLAVALLNRSKSLLFGSCEHHKELANTFLNFGKGLLSKNNENAHVSSEALKLLNDALDICEKGFSAARNREETMEMRELRSKTLRFISAVHLQKKEFDSVLKCVKVLREADGGDDHPSLSVLAMKAWLGLGRHGEAEKELRGMVINKGIPESVWVSAVEAYFQAAGTAGAETAKRVFLGLLGRCHVSAGAAVRVAHRVVGDGGGVTEGSRVRAKVVAELVSDERVVALFAGQATAKDRTAMHAVLWNCAADHFQSKDYETSAELFEKSMLYIPCDTEKRVLRAKGFRVLCLCYLGLSQLDRAQEYINEAEKLEPNVVCAFLKFKIYLQKSDHIGAISQIQAMTTSLDFQPDFLSLSAHEAVACHALPVAVASLSSMLSFYASGKSMPTAEVTVLRTLVTILTREHGNEQQALKFLKHAHTRAFELGPDNFFGKEEVGRRERNWFALTSWNFGAITGQDKNYELSVEFLKLASDFYALVEGSDYDNNVMVCKSLVLSASAMIASERQRKTAMPENDVKQAKDLLDRAGKMLKSVSAGSCVNDDQTSSLDPDLIFIYTFCAYDIQGRLNDVGSQLLHVKSFASSKACKPHYLLQIGLCASHGPRSNHEVAAFALNECLSSFLSSPSPDYQNIALIVRKLIAVASIHKGDTDDNVVYGIYKQAYRIMVGLKEGDYPIEEGKWLAMTAWNRAAVPVRMGHIEIGKKWMSVGLEIANYVPGMEAYKACMEDFLSSLEKRL